MGDIVIRVEGLGKLYRIGQRQRYKALRDTLTDAMYAPFRAMGSFLRKHPAAQSECEASNFIWALKNISFEVKHGEVIGIIGRNGAGKSTLLKLLSRITEPTEGYAEIHGRVGSLLEVGTGFHPELTGRENIYLNGAILGMKKTEIERKFDEIVSFAEIDQFLDTPVKHYSSGMYVRLAFAVGAHLNPEILVIDEVLAVGDVQFQKKCLGKMEEVSKKSGRTILFVSHNTGAISELCGRGILLDCGQKIADGRVDEVLSLYSQLGSNKSKALGRVKLSRDSSLHCSILEISILNSQGLNTTTFDLTEDITIALKYEVTRAIPGLMFNVTLARSMVHIINSFDTDTQAEILSKEPGLYVARHVIPRMFLKAGHYSLTVGMGTPDRCFQQFQDILQFQVEELTVNTTLRGYRSDRLGHIISPGLWRTERLDNV